MTKTASLNIRLNPEIKKTAENIYAHYGLSLTEAVTVFIHQSCNLGGLPFDLRPSVPNTETLAAIAEVQEMKRNPHLYKSFDSVEELFEDLDDDE
jgi:DNA-damage-inducible protein J